MDGRMHNLQSSVSHGGAQTFIDLTDTPSALGQESQVLTVSGGAIAWAQAQEGVDWSVAQTENIHTSNYTNTTYQVEDGGLTTNDFTNTLKAKLDGIASGATATPDWSAPVSGSVIDSSNYTDTTYAIGNGGLTTNDFTNTLKAKLDGIASNATATPDWSAPVSGSVIDSSNYTDTTYDIGDGGLTEKNFTTTLYTKLDGLNTSEFATTGQLQALENQIQNASVGEGQWRWPTDEGIDCKDYHSDIGGGTTVVNGWGGTHTLANACDSGETTPNGWASEDGFGITNNMYVDFVFTYPNAQTYTSGIRMVAWVSTQSPDHVEVHYSTDGTTWTTIGQTFELGNRTGLTAMQDGSTNTGYGGTHGERGQFIEWDRVQAKYIRLRILTNHGYTSYGGHVTIRYLQLKYWVVGDPASASGSTNVDLTPYALKTYVASYAEPKASASDPYVLNSTLTTYAEPKASVSDPYVKNSLLNSSLLNELSNYTRTDAGLITVSGGVPSEDGKVLTSNANGTATWVHHMSSIGELTDVDGSVPTEDGKVLTSKANGTAQWVPITYWSEPVPGSVIHPSNYVGGVDWSVAQTENIHASNYTDTTYQVGDGGLTTNDFTNTLKAKLDGIAIGATATPDWSVAQTENIHASNLNIASTIDDTVATTDFGILFGDSPGNNNPVNLRDLSDGYPSYVSTLLTLVQESGGLRARWKSKADAGFTVGDGGLTERNFTSTLKTKLDGIAENATATTPHIPSSLGFHVMDSRGSMLVQANSQRTLYVMNRPATQVFCLHIRAISHTADYNSLNPQATAHETYVHVQSVDAHDHHSGESQMTFFGSPSGITLVHPHNLISAHYHGQTTSFGAGFALASVYEIETNQDQLGIMVINTSNENINTRLEVTGYGSFVAPYQIPVETAIPVNVS